MRIFDDISMKVVFFIIFYRKYYIIEIISKFCQILWKIPLSSKYHRKCIENASKFIKNTTLLKYYWEYHFCRKCIEKSSKLHRNLSKIPFSSKFYWEYHFHRNIIENASKIHRNCIEIYQKYHFHRNFTENIIFIEI